MKIYHIVTPEVWEKFKTEEFYEAESLHTEGFIHCSFAGQLEGVLAEILQRCGEGFDFNYRAGKIDFQTCQ